MWCWIQPNLPWSFVFFWEISDSSSWGGCWSKVNSMEHSCSWSCLEDGIAGAWGTLPPCSYSLTLPLNTQDCTEGDDFPGSAAPFLAVIRGSAQPIFGGTSSWADTQVTSGVVTPRQDPGKPSAGILPSSSSDSEDTGGRKSHPSSPGAKQSSRSKKSCSLLVVSTDSCTQPGCTSNPRLEKQH